MRKLLLIFIGCTLLVSCNLDGGNTHVSEPKERSSPLALPEKYISDNFKGWEMSSNHDYVKAWWSFYSNSGETTKITTDFNDDGLSDYAFILKSKAEKRYKLVILIAENATFKKFEAENFHPSHTGEDLQHGIFVEPPGKIDVAYPEIKSLILKSNALSLKNFEVNQGIYYWENDGFKVFTMGRGY